MTRSTTPTGNQTTATNAAAAQANAHSDADLIENFFVNGKSIASNLKEIRKLTPPVSNEAPASINPILLSDEYLERWLSEKASSECPEALDISAYDINRILIHALLTKPSKWTKHFSNALKLVTDWLLLESVVTTTVICI